MTAVILRLESESLKITLANQQHRIEHEQNSWEDLSVQVNKPNLFQRLNLKVLGSHAERQGAGH